MNYFRGRAAMKVIVVGGALTFFFLLLIAQMLKHSIQPTDPARANRPHAQSPFDGERAYDDLKKVLAFGPRVAGSVQSAKLRAYIENELTKSGLQVREQAFEADTPIGVRRMVNIVGVVQGSQPGVIIVGNHYDTKYFPEFRFVGANDGGSTTAWMIEMARVLGPKRVGRSIWLLFFDGEEAFKHWSATDSLYGSRAYVAALRKQKKLSAVAAMINVDMIGDCYLGINKDGGAPQWLTNIVWNEAKRLHDGSHFLSIPTLMEDDHLPFRSAGVPALELIDFCYGPTPAAHKRNWHTPNDTIDKVCPASLQVVGDVVYHSFAALDAYLDKNGQH